MATIRNQSEDRLRRPGLHGLIIVGLLVAVAVGATFALTGDIQDNISSLTGSNRIAITSITAYTAGDRLVISGNIQNLGSQPLDSVTIDEITAGDLVITQASVISDGQIVAGHGTLSLAGLEHDGSAIDFGEVDIDDAVAASTGANRIPWAAIAAGSADDFKFIETAGFGGAIVDISGLSTDEGGLEPLAAGSSTSFRITVTGISSGTNPNVLDIPRTVPASTSLFMTVSATDGQTSTISDPRNVRVTAR